MTSDSTPAGGTAATPDSTPTGGSVDTAGATSPARRRSARRLVLVLAALASAGCLGAAGALTWWRRDYHDTLSGAVHTELSGSAVLGELVPVAAFAVAGLGAALATRGWLRRVVGALLVLAGGLEIARIALALGDAPLERLQQQLVRPAQATGGADLVLIGPVLGLVGAALLVLAGILVMATRGRSGGMGAAYDAPGARRERARRRTAGAGTGDRPDDGEWWRALDAGVDPTIGADDGPGAGGDE